MKHLFIVNPTAGKKDRSAEIARKAYETLKPMGVNYEIYLTRAPHDAERKIREEAASGEQLFVYACGGDGTLNECVNAAVGLKNVAVTNYPCGTGNDFIKIFGDEKERFFDLAALATGEVHAFDVIETCGRYSINICSVGADARIGTDVHKYSSIPLIGGAAGYVVSLVVNVFKGLNMPIKVSGCGFEYEGECALICACNGQYYGGGFHPVPQARPDTGELHFHVVRGVKLYEFPGLIGKYASGRWEELPADKLTHLVGKELIIDSPEDIVINIDGEALYRKHINFTVVPGGINFFTPKHLKFFEQ